MSKRMMERIISSIKLPVHKNNMTRSPGASNPADVVKLKEGYFNIVNGSLMNFKATRYHRQPPIIRWKDSVMVNMSCTFFTILNGLLFNANSKQRSQNWFSSV